MRRAYEPSAKFQDLVSRGHTQSVPVVSSANYEQNG